VGTEDWGITVGGTFIVITVGETTTVDDTVEVVMVITVVRIGAWWGGLICTGWTNSTIHVTPD